MAVGARVTESDLISQIYSTVADPERWTEVMVRISDYLGSSGGLLNHIQADGRALTVLARLSEEHGKVYQQHHVWNPWSLGMKDVPPGKAVIANSLIGPGQLSKSGFMPMFLHLSASRMACTHVMRRCSAMEVLVGLVSCYLRAALTGPIMRSLDSSG